jgi:hypothetical protein
VATEIIEDDDVARLQRWGQSLIDIGPEARAVDSTIENPWDLDKITPLATGCSYDHISASGRPEYNLNTEQQPSTAPVATKTGQPRCGSRCSYPDFGSIAKPAPAGG